LQLDGSLIVLAENILGSMNPAENGEPILQYGYRYSTMLICSFLSCVYLAANLTLEWSQCTGVEDASYKMSKYAMRELIGVQKRIYTGGIRCIDLRH